MELLATRTLVGQIDARTGKRRVASAVLLVGVEAGLRPVILLKAPWFRLGRRPRFDMKLGSTGLKVVMDKNDVARWADALASAPWRRPRHDFELYILARADAAAIEALRPGTPVEDVERVLAPRALCCAQPLDDEILFFGEGECRTLFEQVEARLVQRGSDGAM